MTRYIRADTIIRDYLYNLSHAYNHTGYNRSNGTGRDQAIEYLRGFYGGNPLDDTQREFILAIHSAARTLDDEGVGRLWLRLASSTFDGDVLARIPIPGLPRHEVALVDSRPYETSSGPISSYYGPVYPSDLLGTAQPSGSGDGAINTNGLVLSNYNGWYVVQPEDMTNIPERMREYVAHSVSAEALNRGRNAIVFEYDDNGVGSIVGEDERDLTRAMRMLGYASLDAIMDRARTEYRAWIISRRGAAMNEAQLEFDRKRREHAAATARRFETFRSANMCQDQLIPTLPFVPHGLAASRRWGIEVESGGARGVNAPKDWTRKRDGSLRSAWDGYTEVQDFEPHDEERTENIEWWDCEHSMNHVRYTEAWDAQRQVYVHTECETFVSPDDCDSCGTVTRTVHVTPQTITHQSQNDDCAEFVSPILTSMHSNGLEALVGELFKQPQNDTAGVHVHVESNDLTNKQIALLVYGYDQIERFIESSYQRGRRDYARRQSADRVLRAARDLKKNSGNLNWVRDAERYLTVNVQALRAHGTIEFRAMGPVYNYDHLIRWAMFCREMVNVVAGGATYKDFGRIKKWGDLLAIFAKYGKEYTRAAVYEMTGETGSAASLSKSNSPMTTAALNADLETVILGFQTSTNRATDAFRAMAAAYATIPNVTAIRSQVQPRLVTATRTLASV